MKKGRLIEKNILLGYCSIEQIGCLIGLVQGMSIEEVANSLDMPTERLEHLVAHMQRVINVKSQKDLVAVARKIEFFNPSHELSYLR